MSEVYRRLGEVLPAGARTAMPFAADARHVAVWIEALPRADIAATRRSLLIALDALSTSTQLKGGTRREIAELLRPIVMDAAISTQRQFAGKPLPLMGELAVLPNELMQLHLRLGHAYRLAASDQCAPSGNLPWLRGAQVTEALQRAVHHFGEAMLAAWRVYVSLPEGAWHGLHRVYRFAVARELERRPSNDPLLPGLAPIRERYVQLLLMSVLNPRGFSQVEQERAWSMCDAFAPRSVLRDSPTSTSVGVPDDGDEGPGGKSPPREWLDLVQMATAVEAALASGTEEEATVVVEMGPALKFSVDGLRKMRRAFSQAASRQFMRLDGGHEVETVFGLSGIHFQASGERDFDAFARQVLGNEITETARATWSAGSGDVSGRNSRVPAMVVDQSLGGYRMSWSMENQTRLRVGEIVGIHVGDAEDPADWMLGVFRWLRYESDGSVMAGVELLSRSVSAVALAQVGRTPWRALELRPSYGGDEWLYLSTQRLPMGDKLQLGREKEIADRLLDRRPADHLSELRLVQVLGEYLLYRYAPTMKSAHS